MSITLAADDLLTVDEAREVVVRSAAEWLRQSQLRPAVLLSVLVGGRYDGPGHLRALAQEHTETLARVVRAGHGWVIADQLEGILSATGLAQPDGLDIEPIEGQLRSFDDAATASDSVPVSVSGTTRAASTA